MPKRYPLGAAIDVPIATRCVTLIVEAHNLSRIPSRVAADLSLSGMERVGGIRPGRKNRAIRGAR